jgi:hypothetical protein
VQLVKKNDKRCSLQGAGKKPFADHLFAAARTRLEAFIESMASLKPGPGDNEK